jgi:hypothetical protein
MQQIHLLPHLLDNYATVFVVVIVGTCRQDGGGGKEQPLLPMPPLPPTGGRDTEEIKEFCRRRPDCNVYVDRATRDGLTGVQGRCRGLSPNDKDDDDGDNNDDNWGHC